MSLFRYAIFGAFLLHFFSYPVLAGQDDTLRPRYGAFLGVNYNLHSADFRNLPGIPNCCPKFTSGSGFGFSADVLYGIPLSGSLFLEPRLGFYSINATLIEKEAEIVNLNNTAVEGEFEHKLETGVSMIGLEPALSYYPIKNLSLNFGVSFAYIIGNSYDQVETITKPGGAVTFLDESGNDSGKRTRNESNGDIPEINSIQYGIIAGISYDLPLNKENTLTLSPEIIYSYGLSSIAKDLDWQASSIRLGVAIRYSPKRVIILDTIVPPEIQPDTVLIIQEEAPQPDTIKKIINPTFLASATIYNERTNEPASDVKIVVRENNLSEGKQPFIQKIIHDTSGTYKILSESKYLEYEITDISGDRMFDKAKIIITDSDTLMTFKQSEENNKLIKGILEKEEDGTQIVNLLNEREFEITSHSGDLFSESFKLLLGKTDSTYTVRRSAEEQKSFFKIFLEDTSGRFEADLNQVNEKYEIAAVSEDINFSSGHIFVKNNDTLMLFEPDKNAKFAIILEKDREFEIVAQGPDILHQQEFVFVGKNDTTEIVNFFMNVSDKLTLRINFPYNESDDPYGYTLDSNGVETKITWKRVVDILAENMLMNADRIEKLILVGHTDQVGPEDFNYRLGLSRVRFIQDELIKRGVPPDKLEIRSEGEAQLLVKRPGEDTETYHKRLRRVELFKVLEK